MNSGTKRIVYSFVVHMPQSPRPMFISIPPGYWLFYYYTILLSFKTITDYSGIP